MGNGFSSGCPGRTFFAEAGRAPHDELASQLRRTLNDPCVKVVLETVTGFVLILNEHRQIVAANQELLDALAHTHHEPDDLLGNRMGEAFNCVHFTEGPDGCGASPHCRTCGAVLAVLASRASDTPVEDECRLSVLRDGQLEAMDFRVRATPLTIGHDRLTALVLHDVSALKRREALEETFFHDFLNTIGGIEGWSRLLQNAGGEIAAREIVELSSRLKEEVLSQKTLLEAEQGKLKIHSIECTAESILERLRLLFEHHPVALDRYLLIVPPPARSRFSTDPSLLLRVLVNMVKNAFEATEPGGQIRMWFEWKNGRPTFAVHNPAFINQRLSAHIFERSFSTRARHGRGLGTYSMKLYGERYLGGSVSFASTPDRGTVFWISLAEQHTAAAPDAGTSQHRRNVSAGSSAANKSKRRLLLVEDDEALLRLGTLILSELDFEVVACRSPAQALREFKNHAESFALVVTDLSMPQLSGIDLARQLTAIRPIPIVLCTGWGEISSSQQQMDEAGIAGVVAKPFTLQSFAHQIAMAMESAAMKPGSCPQTQQSSSASIRLE